jgi:hypothetical protein
MNSTPTARVFWLSGMVLLFLSTALIWAQSPKGTSGLTVEAVIKLSKEGIAEDLIITEIKKNGKAFDLSPEEIIDLKKLGLSDLLLKYMVDPAYNPPPPPAPTGRSDASPSPPPPPSAPPKQYPADKYAGKVPPDAGLYRFSSEAPTKVEVKILLGTQEGAGLGKVLMKKGKTIAYLVGPVAKTRIKEPSPVFYLRLPEGKAIEDIVLVSVTRKADRRELELGPPGPKQQIKPEVRRPFEFLEVGANLFSLTASKLTKGEYLFFQLGSAEPPKGSLGKGFDFGIDEPAK